jgi:tripartite-type tricarboxylate transporter receptor subunit TctC
LIALAKAQPGKLNYGSSGTTVYLGTELFKSMAGIEMVHVPYKGGGPALIALLANEVQVEFDPLPSASFQSHQAGLADFARDERCEASARRARCADRGGIRSCLFSRSVPGTACSRRRALRKAVIDKLDRGIARAVELPDVQAKLTELGSDPYILTPAAFAQVIRRDQDMWQKLIRERNIKVEF